ncbi:hypothetical protein OG413_20585 [Streptomyces sp. NBC_01433]|uniref:hypothetical protein n=1 Tax=Streptomyces sp. NBC_01433 TaxID=2903864 RepID=UPI00224DF7FC|nr:hypothetical protein [Streptomyces sp. NBC_01433]MCX4677672.1 hypothetical protein [Streptomyces sp. NBC_01433]
MSVSPENTPRSFTVLVQDGRVHGVLLTPATEDERERLAFDAYWTHNLSVRVVVAIDAVDAVNALKR